MKPSYVIREYRRQERYANIIPATVQGLADNAQALCGCNRCLLCRLAKFVKRINSITQQQQKPS